MAGEVEVIKAVEGNASRRRSMIGNGLSINRKWVAAYVRVSTDGEEQLQSFQSQKEYYQDKISKNKEWVMVGIYADEAITGTKTVKRDGFLKMINDCMAGMVDVILTKSISRFSRNLVDTLQYVRMLKDKGIAVIFEKENINTLSMESEMALALLSTLAQNEVESLSANVKLGIKMKMKRGELMGFNGCLGYDYHPEDKSITVNQEEAEVVREIFDMYLSGYGAPTIAKELTRLGRKNKKGEVKWTDSGIWSIINNEKYKGDLLIGKTFTVDPISKRRLENMGEEEQYYIKEHHEPIVSPEIWNAAQEIKKSRYRRSTMSVPGTRKKYSRKYAFSSMCECGFCGKYMTRRAHNQTTTQTKPVWKCRTATNFGIENCPHSKSIDEAIIENAFLEMFHLLADNFDDVLDSVIRSVEETLSDDESAVKLQRLDKSLSSMESKRKKLTDMLLDDKITKEAYDAKYNELTRKINQAKGERALYSANVEAQQQISQRMREIRTCIAEADMLDKFDRVVFESIVDKVIVGDISEDGTIDSYKLTFVLKGMEDRVVSDAKNRYKNMNKKVV
ncbi:MAG: recombinase family protein [Ruminococcus flavefaciens]|nr:recombinase family protein [Ruminococcus flavefaciens]